MNIAWEKQVVWRLVAGLLGVFLLAGLASAETDAFAESSAGVVRHLGAGAYPEAGADADMRAQALIAETVSLLRPEDPATERALDALAIHLAYQASSSRVFAWQYVQGEEAIEPVFDCVTSKITAVRIAGLNLLFQIGGQRTGEICVEALKEADVRIQDAAATVLVADLTFLTPAAARRLETVFDDTTMPILRAKLAYALCSHGYWGRGGKPLVYMWERSDSDEERVWLWSAMRHVGGPDVVQCAWPRLLSPKSGDDFERAMMLFLASASRDDIGKLIEDLPDLLRKASPEGIPVLSAGIVFLLGPSFAAAFPDFELDKDDKHGNIRAAAEWWRTHGPQWTPSSLVGQWVRLAQTDCGNFVRRYPPGISLSEGIHRLSAATLREFVLDEAHPQTALVAAQRVQLAGQLARTGDPSGVDYLIDVIGRSPEPLVFNQAMQCLRATTGRLIPGEADEWRQWWLANRDAWPKDPE